MMELRAAADTIFFLPTLLILQKQGNCHRDKISFK